jgi:hypothetical protein
MQKAFNQKRDVVGENGEKQFKMKLLSKICKEINGSTKILFIEEIRYFGQNRMGLVYIYDKDELFYFEKKYRADIITGRGFNNYQPLKIVFDGLKTDFFKGVSELKKKFQNKDLSDAPILQVLLIETTKEMTPNNYDEFLYSPGLIANEKLAK